MKCHIKLPEATNQKSKKLRSKEFKKAVNTLINNISKPKLQIYSLDENSCLTSLKINDSKKNEESILFKNDIWFKKIENFINTELEIKPVKGNPFKERLLKITNDIPKKN